MLTIRGFSPPCGKAMRRSLFAGACALAAVSLSSLAQVPLVHYRKPTSYTFHPAPRFPVPAGDLRARPLARTKSNPLPPHDGAAPTTLEQLIEQANGTEVPYTFTYGDGVQLDSGPFPSLSIFDFNLGNLLPGALVRGDQKFIEAGQLAADPLTPSSGTITISGVSVLPAAKTDVHISPSTIPNLLQGVQTLENQAFSPNQTTTYNCSLHDVNSSADASFQAGVSFGYQSYVNFNNLFSSADTKTQHHVMVNCSVQVFTLNYYPDTTPSNSANAVYFDPAIAVAQASQFIGPGRPPLVLSSVTYGAELFLMADSEASTSDMEDALNASFSYAGFSGGIKLTDKQVATLSSTDIHVLAMGGRATAQQGIPLVFTGAGAAKGLATWLQGNIDVSGGGDATQETGVPISYQLSYLDQAPVTETATVLGVPRQTTDAPLDSATIWFQQDGNGKGKNTIVDIYLTDASGREVRSYRLGDGTTLTNNSQSPTFAMQSLAATSEAAMTGGNLHMLIHPADHDVWKFTAYLTLTFHDGTVMRGQMSNELSSDQSAASQPGHPKGSGKELLLPLSGFVQ